MAKNLTTKQRQVLSFVEEKLADGCEITFNDIANHFNFSANAARNHIKALEGKGHVTYEAFKQRSIRLPPEPSTVTSSQYLKRVAHTKRMIDVKREIFEIPIYSKVLEKEPYLKDEQIEGVIPVRFSDVEYVKDECFAFPFDYASMMGSVGILKGDYVIARIVEGARDNDTVIVNFRGKNTMRRIYFNGNQVILFTDSQEYEPLWCNLSEIKVICKCIGVYRIKI